MSFIRLKSYARGLLSSIQSYRLATCVFCTMSLLMAFVGSNSVMADCTLSAPSAWICSGTIDNQTITGGNSGNQWTFLNGVTGHLTLVAGTGADMQLLDFSAFTSHLTINLSSTDAQMVATGLQIVLQNFNGGSLSLGVVGGTGNDEITGSIGNDSLYGEDGNDTIAGGAGEDDLYGGTGDDSIEGGAGNDGIYGNAGNDVIEGGAGNDSIEGGTGDDVIAGGAGNDSIEGGADNDSLEGGMGSDTIAGGAGNDVIEGGADNDWVIGDAGDDTLSGGAGDEDLILGGEGLEDTLTEVTRADCQNLAVVDVEINECLAEPDVVVIESRPLTPELCITRASRVSFEDNLLLVFSDFTNTANGMAITHIPLSSLRAPTDEEKASGLPIWLAYKDSEFAPGWSVAVYWQANHYGFVIYTDYGKNVYDDTGAICGWF